MRRPSDCQKTIVLSLRDPAGVVAILQICFVFYIIFCEYGTFLIRLPRRLRLLAMTHRRLFRHAALPAPDARSGELFQMRYALRQQERQKLPQLGLRRADADADDRAVRVEDAEVGVDIAHVALADAPRDDLFCQLLRIEDR